MGGPSFSFHTPCPETADSGFQLTLVMSLALPRSSWVTLIK